LFVFHDFFLFYFEFYLAVEMRERFQAAEEELTIKRF